MESRYELIFDDGDFALINYKVTPEGYVVLTYTRVPDEYEGQGVGSELVRKCLEDIKSKGGKVIPSCPFTAAYIRRHPEWMDIVVRTY